MAMTTQSTMTEFSKACDTFQLEHGRYPGAIPENVIADSGIGPIPPISSTENALLDLMGGYRIIGPTTAIPADWDTDFTCDPPGVVCHVLNNWEIRADRSRLGEGPLLFGKPYSPYFTPSASQVAVVKGQVLIGAAGELPDLVDAWGQPIIFLRRARPSGPLVAPDTGGSPAGVQPQFYTQGMLPYTKSLSLGEFGKDQNVLSILNTADDTADTLAQILRHPSLGSYGDAAAAQAGTAQGSYVLISAGADGIYFSTRDGPGTPEIPVIDLFATGNADDYSNPTIVKEYDDIRIFGGG